MKFSSFTGGLFLMFVFFAAASSSYVSAQATFRNNTAITINDNAAASPYPSAVTVSGLAGTIAAAPGSVKVQINNFSHTYSGDVGMVLVSPTGAAFLIQNNAGNDQIRDVTYTLSDDAAMPLPFNVVWTDGSYKPAAYSEESFPAPGPGTDYNFPAPDGTATFASTFGGTNPNGVWNLYVADFAADDAGSIAGGWSLTITTSGGATAGARRSVNADLNGDGKTDFLVFRATNTPSAAQPSATAETIRHPKSYRERMQTRRQNSNAAAAGFAGTPLYWYYNSDDTASAANVIRFGTFPYDDPIPEDFDGDGKDDIAIVRQGANDQTIFYILQSSDNTVKSVTFGLNSDDHSVVGDYDGDRKADLATFRCPATGAPAGQCYFFYRGTLNNPTNGTTYVPFGFGNEGDYLPNPGDFDGDGKYDFCLHRSAASDGQGQFVLLKSSNMAVEYINWGRFDDRIVPGDYDGDGKADFMVTRAGGNGQLNWYLLTRSADGSGTGATPIAWGLADDYETPGDFDGDGKTDIAVWRPDPDPTRNFYYIRRSTDTLFQSVEWGTQNDYPIQNWYVN